MSGYRPKQTKGKSIEGAIAHVVEAIADVESEGAIASVIESVAEPHVTAPSRKFFHKTCGKETRLGAAIAEKYAYDKPSYVFCINCAKPVLVSECEWR